MFCFAIVAKRLLSSIDERVCSQDLMRFVWQRAHCTPYPNGWHSTRERTQFKQEKGGCRIRISGGE